MSLEEVRAQARKFQNRIRKRNIREYSAMVLAIVMAIPLAVFLRSFPLIVVAMGLIIAGTLFIAYQFRKRMSMRSFLSDTAMMLIGMAFMPALGPAVAVFYAVAFTAALIFTGVANKRAARRLQQKIDELRS